ncbi:hypothetical protein [Alteromonas macleodii]|uniref:hypothetical protein n=1 Tax=Alteromonas macleodii TaxID=28108 RepID=UPI00030463E1|nr:hypothetical protein [Alteromonas macleodii]
MSHLLFGLHKDYISSPELFANQFDSALRPPGDENRFHLLFDVTMRENGCSINLAQTRSNLWLRPSLFIESKTAG